MTRRLLRKPQIHAVLLFLVVFVPAWFSISSLDFFVSDTGLRYLQVRELIDQRWRTFAVDYPFRSADPGLEHVPYYHAYLVIDGEIFLSVSPFFPLLASFFYALLGRAGLVLLPVLGGVLSALAVYGLARISKLPGARLLLWGTLLATPLLFYSLEFWDMNLGAALALWAVTLAAQGLLEQRLWPLALAGALASLGFGQRAEIAVFSVALGFALLVASRGHWKGFAAYIAGGAAGALPISVLNTLWVGHPLGVVAARSFGYGLAESYAFYRRPGMPQDLAGQTLANLAEEGQNLGRFLLHVEGGDSRTFIAALLAIIAMAVIFLALRIERFRGTKPLLLGLALAVGAYILWAWHGWSERLYGIVSAFPLFMLSAVYVDGDSDKRGRRQVYLLVLGTVGLFVAAMMIRLPHPGGPQWGVRYLLPIFPLLLYVSFYVYCSYRQKLEEPAKKTLTFVMAGLFLASVLMQLVGVHYLFAEKRIRAADRRLLADVPARVVITDHPYGPSLMAAVEDKEFLYVVDQEGLESLILALHENGVSRFAFVETLWYSLVVPERIGNLAVRQEGRYIYEFQESTVDGSAGSDSGESSPESR